MAPPVKVSPTMAILKNRLRDMGITFPSRANKTTLLGLSQTKHYVVRRGSDGVFRWVLSGESEASDL